MLLGNGNGTFQAKQSFGTGNQPAQLLWATLTATAMKDLVTGDGNGNTASVLLGNGNGTFQARAVLRHRNQP